MSKTLYDVKLIDLLPENLRGNPDIIAASKAADKEFQLLSGAIKSCLTFADIDSVREDVLDLLAAEMNADFYDQTLSLSRKREIVKNAYVYKYQKGTPFAVRNLVQKVFDDGEVQEWFEYGGEPYFFRVFTNNFSTSPENIAALTKAISAVKNTRSHLEGYISYFICGTFEAGTNVIAYCGNGLFTEKSSFECGQMVEGNGYPYSDWEGGR